MSVQRYVFRYKERSASYYDLIKQGYEARRWPYNPFDSQEAADRWNEVAGGAYEKEGGGYTRDLSEAKLIGWRSKRFTNREDGVLIPARIVLEG